VKRTKDSLGVETINPQKTDFEREVFWGSDEVKKFPSRLKRYGRAKERSSEMVKHLLSIGEHRLAVNIGRCGNWLLFHYYFTVGKVRLKKAFFCKSHLLDPFCAIRRGAKQLKAYLDRYWSIRLENSDLRAFLVTLTVKNGEDLKERFDHLQKSVQILHQRTRDSRRGQASKSEWCKVLGLVGTYEVTNIGNGWHPHSHAILFVREDIVQEAFSLEWKQITGDSDQIDIRPFYHPEDPQQDFIEVFKYAVKFAAMSIEQNYHAYKVLRNRRLIYSSGLFRNVVLPSNLEDDPLDDDLPFLELFYKWLPGEGYQLDRERSSKKL